MTFLADSVARARDLFCLAWGVSFRDCAKDSEIFPGRTKAGVSTSHAMPYRYKTQDLSPQSSQRDTEEA